MTGEGRLEVIRTENSLHAYCSLEETGGVVVASRMAFDALSPVLHALMRTHRHLANFFEYFDTAANLCFALAIAVLLLISPTPSFVSPTNQRVARFRTDNG
uniref:Uncharacterized protein n=1 Tax=Trypanosoma vivax (strain Y486) TaxID=1055687 RepID=G0U3A9_TRYVY|nr:hypothetical protein TVY486_0905860 [Trypanosoma vivax Y486]